MSTERNLEREIELLKEALLEIRASRDEWKRLYYSIRPPAREPSPPAINEVFLKALAVTPPHPITDLIRKQNLDL